MFVLTGDYVSHEPQYIGPVAEVLGELSAEFGTYACLGNHDHWTDADLVTRRFLENGTNMLINEASGLRLAERRSGSPALYDHMVGKTDLPTALKGSYPDEMKLLLAHNRSFFAMPSVTGRLTLSGHTHGGQIKVRDRKNESSNAGN